MKEQNPNSDPIRPAYYKGTKVAQFIELFQLNFNLGSVIKYIIRDKNKEERILDLEKARWYLNREISILKGEVEND